MRRFPIILLYAITPVLTLAGCTPYALAAAQPVERRVVHPDGVSLTVRTVDFRSDSIVVAATIANPGDRDIRLNRARSLVLEDGAYGIHYLNPPADNPELRIAAGARLSGELVFIGPLARAARHLSLTSNEGIGTPDNPYDDAPLFRVDLPLAGNREKNGAGQANHPDGAALRVGPVAATATGCTVSLSATNGNDRAIRLNQDGSLLLTDEDGRSVPAAAPADNPDLTVPPGNRLEAELVFPCHLAEASGPVTLSTNRGTGGTIDNPYDTLPVFAVRVAVERHAGMSAAAASRVMLAAIARSHLSAFAGMPTAVAAASSALPAARAEPPARPPPAGGPLGPVLEEARSAAHPAGAAAPKHPVPPSAAQLEAALHASKTDRGLHIVLPADALFGETPDMLGPAADPLLAQLAALIAATHPRQVQVAGHSDGTGNDDDNQKLSEERARAVAGWLEAHAAKHPPRVVGKGYGRTRPVMPNHNSDGSDNPEGRAQNRRVEITLSR